MLKILYFGDKRGDGPSYPSLMLSFLYENELLSNERTVNDDVSFVISKCLTALREARASVEGGSGPQTDRAWDPPFSTGLWVRI